MKSKKIHIFIIAVLIIITTIVLFTNYRNNSLKKGVLSTTSKITTTTNMNPSPNRIIKLNDNNINLKFSEIYQSKDKTVYDIYLDSNGNSCYYYHNTKDLYMIFLQNIKESESKDNKSVKLSISQLKAKADIFLNSVIDLRKYTYINTKEDQGEYRVTYLKRILGYDTKDVISVLIKNDGFITLYTNPYHGAFDKFSTKIDNNKILKYLNSYLKENYKTDNFSIESKVLAIRENGDICIRIRAKMPDAVNSYSYTDFDFDPLTSIELKPELSFS